MKEVRQITGVTNSKSTGSATNSSGSRADNEDGLAVGNLLVGAAPKATGTEQLRLLRAASWVNPAAELGFKHGQAARAQRGLIDVEILLLEEIRNPRRAQQLVFALARLVRGRICGPAAGLDVLDQREGGR